MIITGKILTHFRPTNLLPQLDSDNSLLLVLILAIVSVSLTLFFIQKMLRVTVTRNKRHNGKRKLTNRVPALINGWFVIFALFSMLPLNQLATQQVTFASGNANNNIITDKRFRVDENFLENEIQHFLDRQAGLLKTYQEVLPDGKTQSAARTIADFSLISGLNPKVTLILLELKSQLLSSNNRSGLNSPFQFTKPDQQGFNNQLELATHFLGETWLNENSSNTIVFKDGSSQPASSSINKATFALQVFLALGSDPVSWEKQIGLGAGSFNQLYTQYFGDPLASSSQRNPQASPQGPAPFLRRPFADGDAHNPGLANGYQAADGLYYSDPPDQGINTFFDHIHPGTNYFVGQYEIAYRGVQTPHNTRAYPGHDGIDFNTGTRNVLAAASGYVRSIGFSNSCGANIYINHPDNGGYITLYQHLLSTPNFTQGQYISEGTLLGQSGYTDPNNSCTAGGHLHFGVYEPQFIKPVDPFGFCPASVPSDPWSVPSYWLWKNNTSPCQQQNPNNSVIAPTNLIASVASSSQLNLFWKDNTSNESGFKVERKIGASGTWVQIGTTGANVTSYLDTGLRAGISYFYRVRAYGATGDSAYSNEADNSPNDRGLIPVYRFYNASNPSHVYIAGDTEANDVLQTSYWQFEKLAFYAYAATGNTCSIGSPVYRLWSDLNQAHFFTISQSDRDSLIVDPGWHYERVAFCAFVTQVSGSFPAYRFWSEVNTEHFYTSDEAEKNYLLANYPTTVWNLERVAFYVIHVPLAAPSALAATAPSANQINLSWTDNSDNEDGFRIERKTGLDGTYSQIGTVGANVKTFQNTTGLEVGKTYFYRVRSYNQANNSAYSNETLKNLGSGFLVPVYRFYIASNPSHLYSADEAEITYLLQTPDLQLEKLAFYAYAPTANTCTNGSPVYRLWSDLNKAHFFTISQSDKDALIVDPGWHYEWVAFCAFPTQVTGSVPAYRFWSDVNTEHFYTSDEAEKNYLLANYPTNVWRLETIAFYVFNSLTNPNLKVTITDDRGEALDSGAVGTLSYALAQATDGQEITFELPNGLNTVNVTGKLPDVKPGVKIRGVCTNGQPGIIINGIGISATLDGLILKGRNRLEGVRVTKFKGRQIMTNVGGNQIVCTEAIK